MGEFKISVLVTFFNQEKYVDTAINSIMQQDISDSIQIVIGDDGSSDATVEKAYFWQEKYPHNIEIHVMQRDSSRQIPGFRASRIRLELLKYVKGEFFIFLDGDDYFTNRYKLRRQMKILLSDENRDCIACAHNIEALYPDGKKVLLSNAKEGKYNLKQYWSDLYFHTDTILIRRELIDLIPKELVMNNYNDNMITFLAFQYGQIYYIPECMAIYLQTGDGIWTSGKKTVNAARNLFLYDLCTMIDPKTSRETDVRFYQSWIDIWKQRHQIDEDQMQPYIEEARRIRLKYSVMWLNYFNLSILGKTRLYMHMGLVLFNSLLYKIKKRINGKEGNNKK